MSTNMTSKVYKRVGLIGVGLMGSSIALGLRKAGVVETWVGMDRDPSVIQDALRIGVIQEVTNHLEELVRKVDWLLLSVPVKTTVELAARIVPLIENPDYFIIDVGSTKREIVSTFQAAFRVAGKTNVFLGCHPIAGKEKTGPLVADPDLFNGKTVYVTPTPESAPELIERVEWLWKRLGSETRRIDPLLHDDILSVSSHLPHMVAYALMDAVQAGYADKQISHSLAGGLKDMTRVVASSPQMWTQICRANRDNIVKQMDIFEHSLERLRELIEKEDSDSLHGFFTEKKAFRDLLG